MIDPAGDSREDKTVGPVVGLFLVVWGYCINIPRNRNCFAEVRSLVHKHTAWFVQESTALLIQLSGRALLMMGARHG